MLANWRLALVAPLLFALSACSTTHRISYFDAIAAAPADNVMRVYVDGFGSIYPREPLAANAIADYDWDGSLFQHFTDGNSPCDAALLASEVRDLCEAVNRAAPELNGDAAEYAELSAWYDSQLSIWRERGERIAKRAVANGSEPTIVFLLHGFNTRFSEAVPDFAKARRMITERSPTSANLLFVEVFWDGCSVPLGVRCWGQAQASGPLVGFYLRPMFNAMNDELDRQGTRAKVRMLSHSSGAFVIGSTVGNPARVLPLLEDDRDFAYQRFADNASAKDGVYRVPTFDDLAIGMLAPATTVKTFSGSAEGSNEGMLSGNARLLYGINPDDEVITKGFVGCDRFGVTCMASSYENYCEYLADNPRLNARGIEAIAYDFKRESKREKHEFIAYLEQIETQTSFLADLLGPAGQMQQDGVYTCPPPEAAAEQINTN